MNNVHSMLRVKSRLLWWYDSAGCANDTNKSARTHARTHTHTEYEDRSMQYFDHLSNESNNIGFTIPIAS